MQDLHTSTGALNPALIKRSYPNPNVDKVPKKVSFRDEKGRGFGIADIYYVEKI